MRKAMLGVVMAFAITGSLPAMAREGCGSPTTWTEQLSDLCHFTTHVVEGKVLARTPVTSPAMGEIPCLCVKLEVTRVFRGDLGGARNFEFWMKDKSLGPRPEEVPAVGEEWLVFSTAGLRPGTTVAPPNVPEAFWIYPVRRDSISAPSLPPVSRAALLDTLAAIYGTCRLTPADTVLLGLR
jgi:hypothetical protein